MRLGTFARRRSIAATVFASRIRCLSGRPKKNYRVLALTLAMRLIAGSLLDATCRCSSAMAVSRQSRLVQLFCPIEWIG